MILFTVCTQNSFKFLLGLHTYFSVQLISERTGRQATFILHFYFSSHLNLILHCNFCFVQNERRILFGLIAVKLCYVLCSHIRSFVVFKISFIVVS